MIRKVLNFVDSLVCEKQFDKSTLKQHIFHCCKDPFSKLHSHLWRYCAGKKTHCMHHFLVLRWVPFIYTKEILHLNIMNNL